MKIQILGHRGMLGQQVWKEGLQQGHEIITKDVGPIETMEPPGIMCPIIINCAGVVKQRSVSKSRMVASNAVGPHRIAEMAERVGSRLIHVSTDCVFVGKGPHDEDDIPDADDLYATSKRAGEVVYGPHLTVRTSFVGFGPRGLLNDLLTQPSVTVSQNLLWSGHTASTVAKMLLLLVEHPHATGLLHMPGEFQNRYTLARDLKSVLGLRSKLIRDDGFVADRRLSSYKWTFLGLPEMPSFESQLTELKMTL